MPTRMTLKYVLEMLFVGLIFACNSSAGAESPLLGRYEGDWDVYHRPWTGKLEVELLTIEGNEVVGRVKATPDSGRAECSREWEKLTGKINGTKVSAQYNLGGPCGNVKLDFLVEPSGIAKGTYATESSAGRVRLKRQ